MGCAEETFSGLVGMCDLIVTITSQHSRNNRTGILIALDFYPKAAIEQVGMAVEGVMHYRPHWSFPNSIVLNYLSLKL